MLVRWNMLLPQKKFTGFELTGSLQAWLVSRMDDYALRAKKPEQLELTPLARLSNRLEIVHRNSVQHLTRVMLGALQLLRTVAPRPLQLETPAYPMWTLGPVPLKWWTILFTSGL